MTKQPIADYPAEFLNMNGKEISGWGTFKDSLRAPIHNWFTYPAGFSYKAVIFFLKKHGGKEGQSIFDPFMGSGTTNLVAKSLGFNSYGVEAHHFIYPITNAKLNWDIDLTKSEKHIETIKSEFNSERIQNKIVDLTLVPELLLKCFEYNTLNDLVKLRDLILSLEKDNYIRNIYFVALVALLREVSSAATGWPYIAPNKIKKSSIGKVVIDEYVKLVKKMLNDISLIKQSSIKDYKKTNHNIYLGDCRDTSNLISDNAADFIFTSPPYLNNFDYADRTRLEMYFFQEANTWGEITTIVRNKLMTSATTQINRNDRKYILSDDIKNDCIEVYEEIQTITEKLYDLRLTKGGKKSYDLLVSGYFNDMYRQLKDSYRVLKKDGVASYVLGDSAPYGVHVKTDVLLGKMAKAVGFSDYNIEVLRTRGGKWKDNPQRHSVPLRESIVTFYKN